MGLLIHRPHPPRFNPPPGVTPGETELAGEFIEMEGFQSAPRCDPGGNSKGHAA